VREVLLVGGSGGLGAAAGELLSREGNWRLLVSYRANAERARQWADKAVLIQADITQAGDRKKLLQAAPGLYGLVVFSGDPSRVTAPEQLEEVSRRSWEVNYLGPILLARAAAEQMRAAGTPGAIVLVSTMQAVALFANSTAYATAKSALIHGARILAKECRGPANIRVNVVCPGVNQAGMAQASIAAGKYDHYLRNGVIARFGQAADVARAVRFFLEPDNYVTGQVLTVDGGLTL
jgi:NAD(P)-dependent dehydrogenase (short-subunit alcohol dehydrogenase family)